jgi:hypothetical protein
MISLPFSPPRSIPHSNRGLAKSHCTDSSPFAPAHRTRYTLRAALPHQLGFTWRPRREPEQRFRQSLQRRRPSQRRAGARPERARHARRYAGRLGRRVWPHPDRRESQDRRKRPPHRRFHHVDGRWWRQPPFSPPQLRSKGGFKAHPPKANS